MLPLKHWFVSLMLVGVVIVFGAEAGTADSGIEAITNPSADVTLSFVQPGRIATVHLQEGDTVKAGQVLVKQDDAVEQAMHAIVGTLHPHRHPLRIENQAAATTDGGVIENIAAVDDRHAGCEAHFIGVEDKTLLVDWMVGHQFGADRVGRQIPFYYRDGLRDLADGDAMMFAGTLCFALGEAQCLRDLTGGEL